MQLPKKIRYDNLTETIVEVGVSPVCSLELWPGMISSPLEDLGYKYVPSSSGNVVDAFPCLFTSENIWFGLSEKRIYFNCKTNHYVGWNIYSREIRKVLTLITNLSVVNNFNYAEIRYINAYENKDIIEHINGNFVLSASEMSFACYGLLLENCVDNMRIIVSLTNRMQRRTESSEETFPSLFDVDVYKKFDAIDSVEMVCESLNSIHKTEKETFWGLLRDDFKQSLSPEY